MPVTDYTPDVQQVANVIMSRTVDQYGNVTGTFSGTTKPTDTQVTNITTQIAQRIADVIGDDIPPQLFESGKGVVAERVAMQIELDFFSDQVNTGRSIYPQLKDQYDADLKNLLKQIQLIGEGADPTKTHEAGATNKAQGTFPDQSQFPGYGLGTIW